MLFESSEAFKAKLCKHSPNLFNWIVFFSWNWRGMSCFELTSLKRAFIKTTDLRLILLFESENFFLRSLIELRKTFGILKSFLLFSLIVFFINNYKKNTFIVKLTWIGKYAKNYDYYGTQNTYSIFWCHCLISWKNWKGLKVYLKIIQIFMWVNLLQIKYKKFIN